MMRTNPFPGMNPWLERYWGDVHTRLTTYASDQLQAILPVGLRASIEEYVALEVDDERDIMERRRFSPDVLVTERPLTTGLSGGAAVAEPEAIEADEPLRVRRLAEPMTLRRLQIIDINDRHRVVTSIEFLNLANKVGEARVNFKDKQTHLLEGGVNLVEIDLLRAGGWVMAAEKAEVPRRYREPYRVCVVRADRNDDAEFYRATFRGPLPNIRIPLRPADADVRLRLQPLLDAAYVNGRYGDLIDYSQPPALPLEAEDAAWVEAWLRSNQVV